MLTCVKENIPISKLAIHCHDTYGRAISNIEAAIDVIDIIFVTNDLSFLYVLC